MEPATTPLVMDEWANTTGPSNNGSLPQLGVWGHLNLWVPPICFILGITGNSLCLAAICFSRTLLAPASRIYMTFILLSSDVILTSAGVNWLGVTLVNYLPTSSGLNVVGEAVLTDIGCQLMEYFRMAALFVLVWLLVAMTGERYVTLARPFALQHRPGSTAAIISTVVIILGFGAAVSRFFTAIVSENQCGINDLGVMVLLVDVLAIYLLPPVFLAVLAVCLSCMLCEYARYRRRQKLRPAAARLKQAPEVFSRPNAELAVTMAFIFCGGLLPLFAWSVLTLISVIWGEDPVIDTAAAITLRVAKLLLLLLSASHFSYFIMAGARFRKALGAVLCGCLCSDTSGDEEGSVRSGSRSSNGCGAATSSVQINLGFADQDHTEMTQL